MGSTLLVLTASIVRMLSGLEVLTGDKWLPRPWWLGLHEEPLCLADAPNCAAYRIDPAQISDPFRAIGLRINRAVNEHNRSMLWNEIGGFAICSVAGFFGMLALLAVFLEFVDLTMSMIVGILITVAVLYVINVGRSIVGSLLVINNSINAMTEGIKDSSERTEERLQEIHAVLDSLHSLFGGRLYQRDETDKYTDGPTIQELLMSIDGHLETMAPERAKYGPIGLVRLVR